MGPGGRVSRGMNQPGGAGDSPARASRTAKRDAASFASPRAGQANRQPHQHAGSARVHGEWPCYCYYRR